MLDRIIKKSISELVLNTAETERSLGLVKILITKQIWFENILTGNLSLYQALEYLLEDGQVRKFIQLNRYKEILWFNKESFEELLWWMYVIMVIRTLANQHQRNATTSKDFYPLNNETAQILIDCYGIIKNYYPFKKIRIIKLIDC